MHYATELPQLRIAVISDIHGNCFALDAALSDIRTISVDNIVCLGDTVQGGPQPKRTIERLREISCPIVMGNADAWLLDEKANSAEATAEIQRKIRTWTLSKLTPEDLAFIRSYKATVKISIGNEQNLLCFHGSPVSYNDILLPNTPKDQWDHVLGPFSPAIMAGGHTHAQQMRRVRDGLFFNPGSIGVVYNYSLLEQSPHTDSWAEYAILTIDRKGLGLEFRRSYFDLEKYLQLIRDSGRPDAEAMIEDYATN